MTLKPLYLRHVNATICIRNLVMAPAAIRLRSSHELELGLWSSERIASMASLSASPSAVSDQSGVLAWSSVAVLGVLSEKCIIIFLCDRIGDRAKPCGLSPLRIAAKHFPTWPWRVLYEVLCSYGAPYFLLAKVYTVSQAILNSKSSAQPNSCCNVVTKRSATSPWDAPNLFCQEW